jgi:hypothetical protein
MESPFHFVLSAAPVVLYPLLRLSSINDSAFATLPGEPPAPVFSSSKFIPIPGLTQEADIIAVTIALLFHRYRRSSSLAAFASTAVLYGNLAVTVLWYLSCSRLWPLAIAVMAALLITNREPNISAGLTWISTAELTALTVSPKHSAVGKNNSKVENSITQGRKLVFFVLMVRNRSDTLRSAFLRLAKQYGNASRRFVAIDLGQCPDAAAAVGIDVGLLSLSIPVVLEITEGKVVARLPPADAGFGSVVMNEFNIIKYFRLT